MLFDPKIAKEIELLLTTALKNRLKGQGHVASGKGLSSLKTDVIPKGEDLVIQIIGEEYLLNQDKGRRPGSFPPIDALAKWVRQKGIATGVKESRRIAFGIGLNMKKIGMHSRNNRIDLSKRNFISGTINNQQTRIQQLLFKMFEKNFELLVTNTADEIGGNYDLFL